MEAPIGIRLGKNEPIAVAADYIDGVAAGSQAPDQVVGASGACARDEDPRPRLVGLVFWLVVNDTYQHR